jgi:hypothetical protein
MTMSFPLQWSFDVGHAEWVKERLTDLLAGTVSSIVPMGFEAYAQILHPVETPTHGDKLVRWIDVATWGGQALTARSRWLAVAMPEHRPPQPRPWRSQGPAHGTLYPEDARALVEIARRYTDTPQQCWCCIWEGFGWWSRTSYGHLVNTESSPAPSPIPLEAMEWPKVHTRYRDYFLYEASLDTSFMETIEILESHSPNLWWPSDRAWCVGTEVDADSSYVGGSRAFIDALLQSEHLETFEVDSDDVLWTDLPTWMVQLVDRTVDELLASGGATVETSIGTVRFAFDRPRVGHRGFIRYEMDDDGLRGSSGQSPLGKGSAEELQRQLMHRVEEGLRSLAN